MRSLLLLHLVKASTLSVGLSGLLAAGMSFIDWRKNPSGIFRNGDGTNWGFVLDTFNSWFWPSLLLLLPLSATIAVAIYFVSTRKNRPPERPGEQ